WALVRSAGQLAVRIGATLVGVIDAGVEMQWSGELLSYVATSRRRIALGFGLGALGGVSVGLVTGFWSVAEAVGNPLIAATFPIPKIALLPLLILWLGIGEASKVAVIMLGGFFPVAINTHTGGRTADPLLI